MALATTNKGYEVYKSEIRAEAKEGEMHGEIEQRKDPVSGGFKFAYVMSGGRRYEFGYSTPSKLFGSMLFLIFTTGNYLRYRNTTMVTDSAFGFGESVIFLCLWGMKCVTSIRASQKSCFSKITEFKEAFDEQQRLKIAKKKKPSAKKKKQSSHASNIAA